VTPASDPSSAASSVSAVPAASSISALPVAAARSEPSDSERLFTPLELSRKPPTLGSLAPGLTAHLNLYADLFILACVLVLGRNITGDEPRALSFGALAPLVVTALGVWIVTSTALRHYGAAAYERELFDDIAMTVVVLVAVFTILFVLNFAFRALGATPTDLRVLLADACWALSMRIVFRHLSVREAPTDEIIIVGAGIRGHLTAEAIEKRGRQRVIGYIPFGAERVHPRALPLLGTSGDLEHVLRSTPVSSVYVAGNALKDGPAMQHTITVCERLGIPFGLPIYPFRLERARPSASAGVQDGYLRYDLFEPKLRQRALKRLFDMVSSAAALWLLLPLFLVVALLVKVTSRGPAFFKQQRVGLNGRRFNMLKFRSMVMNAEELKAALAKHNEQTGPVFKMRQDPRVTRIGRFIRKYSIDELPQLINVLRGDMSIVGPRPPVPGEVARYEAWQLRRLCVRPGLTCLWQVSGRNQISFEDWMYLDMQYIDHWSLRQDLSLICRTLPVVFLGRGAS
jgi:exopolysaccharide biosynthesis polyprenyl glycosylphosphotransferase